jgi:hypothetical protein
MNEVQLRVLIDANVFVNALALDFILRYSEQSSELVPLYSSEIEDEVRNVLGSRLKNPWEPTHIDGFFEAIESTFPNAKVAGYDHLINSCHVPESDRHVLAAERHGEATHLATFNLKDFPAASLSPFNVEPVHPDKLITLVCGREAQLCRSILLAMAERRRIDLLTLAARLARHLPQTAEFARLLSDPD